MAGLKSRCKLKRGGEKGLGAPDWQAKAPAPHQSINVLQAKVGQAFSLSTPFSPTSSACATSCARPGPLALKSGAEETRRSVYLKLLELRTSARFLEVTAWMSWGMLTRCRRLVRRLHLEAELCQGLAEHLPHAEKYVNCVFHMGNENTLHLHRKSHLEPTIVRRLEDLEVNGDLVSALIRGDVEP